ncbi:MAG: SDR family NAD(P)-dependent oxidoreductase, partial [Chloroflexaceae bacterium]|nr:SDR family NAD(P)-dependent oxidoreductase [Chloroflexaceae bacterium]
LAPFLLTNLLLERLKASAPARIITVSSMAHQGGRMRFDDLNMRRGYNGWGAYGQSKLANVLFTYELAERLQGTGVTANCLHPGFVASNFGRNNGGLLAGVLRLLQNFALTPEQGAETQVYLASAPELEGVTGKYFDKKQAVPSSPASNDKASQRKLWELSEQMVQAAVGDVVKR